MSELDKLLESLKVEWKALGEDNIGKFIRGTGLQKKKTLLNQELAAFTMVRFTPITEHMRPN